METLIEVVGWAGALAVLLAYGLVSAERVTSRSWSYQFLNISGAVGLVINSSWNGAIPSAVVNLIWIGIGAYALMPSVAEKPVLELLIDTQTLSCNLRLCVGGSRRVALQLLQHDEAISRKESDSVLARTVRLSTTCTASINASSASSKRIRSLCAFVGITNQRRCASGKSYSIRMASTRPRTPRTRENGRRDVAKVAPSIRAIIDTEPLHTLHRRATRSARRAFVQSVRSASTG